MYGRPSPPFHHSGGGGRAPAPPRPQQQQPPYQPQYPLQNPNNLLYLQNPNLLLLNNLLHNINNVPIQPQNPNCHAQNMNFQPQNYHPSFPTPQPQLLPQSKTTPANFNVNEVLERLDRAVIKARRDILASGGNVSAWKVSQEALLALEADSWESLGFQMQQVPSLHRLMAIEAKINTFIHCYVGVRKVTTLYDLELAICKNEGVGLFDELELGPLVRHPLVIHYFSVSPDAKEVFRITSEDIISYLHEFLNTHRCKEVKVDELLDFIAEKRSNTSREKLNVRIQSLGLHISVIQKAVQSENTVLKKHVDGLKKKFGIRIRKRPILSSQKGELDDRFNELSQRMKSLSSVDKIFCGKHIRFASSSSDDDGSDDDDDVDENGNYTDYEDNRHGKDVNRSDANFTSQNLKNSERVSSCPYPSASEEMTRLGLKPDADSSLADDTDDEENSMKDVMLTRKRKSTRDNESISLPTKLPKREDKTNFHTGDHKKKSCSKDTSDSSFVNDSTRMFLTTWKETCRNNCADEILDRMLHLYGTRKKKLLRALFSSYPFSGLLDVAVKSIKSGMWDSMYDTFQTFDQQGALNSIAEKPVDCISIEVESDEENAPISATKLSKNECCVTVNDIIEKISKYFDLDGDVLGYTNPTKKMRLSIWRKLYRCESWLVEQLSVKEFECLGFGDFVMFLERYWHQLPDALQKFLIGDECENLPFEACMLQLQLDVLLSQASNNIWQNEKMSKKLILGLLSRQFPSICFKSVKNDFLIDFEDMLRKNERNVAAKCVLFSATLLKENGVGCSSSLNEKILPDSAGSNLDIDPNAGSLGLVTTKDAIEVLLRAPMLTDLDIWAHWDTKYAPSLGSLVVWLLNEVNIRELLCLVTKGGKVIRLDHSATMESFLDVLLEGSSFGTAVKLLSLLALYGGEGNVPLSLLKCHAQKAFEVIIKSIVEKECHSDQGFLVQGESMPLHDVLERSTSWNLSDELYRDRSRVSKVLQVISRFMLDCLSYLPTEFCSFAATVLLAGLQTLVKDAPSAILSECKKVEQRIMLHDVGFSLGILEWIDDHHQFWSSTLTNSICTSESSCSRDASYDCNWGTGFLHNRLEDFLPSVSVMAAPIKSDQNDDHKEVNSIEQIAEVSVHLSPDNTADRLSKPDCIDDPMGVIDSIRRDEFGLDPSLSTSEGRMLMKQHARLGRALHCLSHELYSQDSHFLLELVQNADDNIYPQNVEPSLTFILQEKSIVVLNNEMGFSAENIRALCDVGNSTKREHSAGYIGKKGIGFKSVFRVTDAPEIHSNGFHIKFDVTEGQIGFVLPTVVPYCDTELYSRLLSTNADHVDYNSWRTCIVLPFKAALSQGFAMNKIVSMFSDLHPSLLLFLHRLQCIKLRNMLDNSLTVMRKEVAGDGIIKVSMGKEKMVWLVVSQKLQSNTIRHDANETEISIAFSLEETSNGEYIPQLHQQPAFAFLPLRTYGLKFIVQGDFVLPSSREEVDGDSPWNQWLLSEIPKLFVSAQKSFCDLPCFRDNAAKAVTAFMSFVPFVGEVHGFFSSLPRLIMSKLRMSNCLLLEADKIEWVPPCKVLGKWNEQARVLLPNWLLHKHLGLGFLKKDIILSDSLARALGIEEYGPKTLFHAILSLSRSENGLKDMGLCWLSTWINEFYLMPLNSGTESDLIFNLRKIPFIPLSDGKYCSVDRGTIWLHCDAIGVGNEYDFKCFPKLYTKLQIVNPALFSAAVAADKSCLDASVIENVTRMLIKVGVQRLSAHEIVKVHILPSISDSRNFLEDKDLLTDYLSFILFHLQSSCPNCCTERDWIMAHLRNEAVVLTNYGYKKLNEVPIHFSKEFRNPIDMNKLVTGIDMKWHELDSIYLKHPITKSVPDGLLKWRNFFQELGITDFVQMVQIEKSTGNVGMTPMGPNVKDWESWELDHMLSQFSSIGDLEKCKYLLEILDTLWDDYFRDKVTGSCTVTTCEAGKSFNSSVISILQNAKWMVSVMDDDLHYPKDLFLDCEAVRSILGVTAPYAIPKVRNQMLLDALGLKSHVRIHDILSLLEVWRRRETPFKASIAQMSRLYTFIWSEMATSKSKIMEELSSGPFIFFPYVSGCSPEDIVTGVFLSPKEVYWHDTTGSMDQMKLMQPKCDPDMNKLPFVKMLSRVYPILHDFFVNECGVEELPPINGYLQFLVQLSATALPSEVARTVFNVFSKWADRLKCGSLNNKDTEYLRERFLEKECAVLPTAHDKWVSLHPSFGLICWSDDDKLRKEFKYLEGVEILCFGNLMDEEKDLLQTKVANLMSRLGIPALSAVVSREAIYYGPTDSSLKASLVNWALPYAQRYICHVHPDKYLQLEKTGFGNVKCLQIVVVEKLFYRNVVKRCDVVSKKRFECSCLLQDKILYATRESDSHTIFMELSRLLFDDAPELHLANFLHMITTMAEAGASEEQTEFFILNSQKVPKLPEGETIWSLSFLSGIVNDESCIKSSVSAKVDESNTFMYKKKSDINSNWPPVGWKTAPGFIFARANGLKTQAGHSVRIREAEDSKEITIQTGHVALANLNSDLSFQGGPCTSPAVHLQFQDGPSSITPEECLQFQDGPIATTPEACVQFQDGASSITQEVCLQNIETPEDQSDHASNITASGINMIFDSVDPVNAMEGPHFALSDFNLRNQLSWGNTSAQAALTGRVGEFVAFRYFAGRVGASSVKWVNEASETGLPYDLLIGNEEHGWEYIEVKATKSRSATRDLAFISVREWQFAFEKGESFSIAHVILLEDNTARVTTYKNPVKLCQLSKLRLAVIMPKQLELSNSY